MSDYEEMDFEPIRTGPDRRLLVGIAFIFALGLLALILWLVLRDTSTSDTMDLNVRVDRRRTDRPRGELIPHREGWEVGIGVHWPCGDTDQCESHLRDDSGGYHCESH